jgi:hypothetical protein
MVTSCSGREQWTTMVGQANKATSNREGKRVLEDKQITLKLLNGSGKPEET